MTQDTDMGGGRRSFPETRLSIVARIARGEPEERQRAWDALIRAYWRPVYRSLRLRFGRSNEDAKDLAQGFFARAIEKDFFAGYDPARSRFRTFLRLCLDRYHANEAKARNALKRGGGEPLLGLGQLDDACIEMEEDVEVAGEDPPAPDDVDAWFEGEWRKGLLAAAMEKLRQDLEAKGQETRIDLLRRYDLAESTESRPTYDELAREQGIPVTTVTNWLFAARRELRKNILDLLREQTESEEEFQDELRELLGGGAA